MPELEQAAGQPSAGTDTGTEDPQLDNPFHDDSSTADSSPETQRAEEDAAGAEQIEGAEAGETASPEEEGSESTSSMDDYLATLTLEERSYYAKRYPTAWKLATDPGQPEDVRALLRDKINGDFDIRRFRAQQEEPSLEEGEAETETAATAQPDVAEQRKQYYSQIDQIVSTQIDPQAVTELGSNLLDAMGVDLKSKDPEIQAIVKNAPKLGQVLAKGAIDLLATVLPNLLPSRMEAAMPEITEMYYDNLRSRTWEKMRSQTVKGPDGKTSTPYADLPQMGTPQWDQAVDKVLREMPELRDMFDNLPPHQRFAKQYAIAAKLMSGQRVNPAKIAEAVDTGKRLADKARVTRAAGRALGAGRSAQQLQTNDNEDPVMKELDEAIASSNESFSPFRKR